MDDELSATVVAQDVAGTADGILLRGENRRSTVGVGNLDGPLVTVRDNVTFVAGHERRSGMQANRRTGEIRARMGETKTEHAETLSWAFAPGCFQRGDRATHPLCSRERGDEGRLPLRQHRRSGEPAKTADEGR